MDQMADHVNTIPITPLICPKCGQRVEFCTSGRLICWNCGEIYYDPETRFWKIRPFKETN